MLSLGDEPGLTRAVESLLGQSQPVELVVVNSGGGDPRRRLLARGLDVPVINRAERLYPGAARNLGIEATGARWVAFLAADCLAEPGWVEARLRAHRAGAAAVASAMVNPFPRSRSACASQLLLHHRRLPGALESERLLFGLSYDRQLFERFGTFRDDIRMDEDTEFNARLGADLRVAWEPDVRTAHLYPDRPLALLRDQWARGRRRARNPAHKPGSRVPRYTPLGALREARVAVRHVRRVCDPHGPRLLRRAAPLLIPAVAAYAGALALGSSGAGLDRYSYALRRGTRRSTRPLSSVRYR